MYRDLECWCGVQANSIIACMQLRSRRQVGRSLPVTSARCVMSRHGPAIIILVLQLHCICMGLLRVRSCVAAGSNVWNATSARVRSVVCVWFWYSPYDAGAYCTTDTVVCITTVLRSATNSSSEHFCVSCSLALCATRDPTWLSLVIEAAGCLLVNLSATCQVLLYDAHTNRMLL